MAPNFAERIKAVDSERLRFALGVFGAAAAMKGPFPNPEQYALNIVDTDDSVSEIRLADIPENRGMLAIKREFPDEAEFMCIGFRIMTLREVIMDQRLLKMGLVRDGKEGQLEIHDAVINALAKAPFRKSGKLDKKAFLALVKQEHDQFEADKVTEHP